MLIHGMIAATLTPFAGDGALDLGMVREHVAFLAEGGLDGIAPAGTTGEALYLSEDERRDLVRAAVEGANGRLRVIAGIWALELDEIERLAKSAADAGAEAVFLTTPIYYSHDDDSLVRYYAAVREFTRLPLFCYSIPAYATNRISVDALERLIEAGTVQGVKDSEGKEERLAELLSTARGRIAVYGASDGFALQARGLGADGFISALANIFPRTFTRIWEGDADAQERITKLRGVVKGYGGIAAQKRLLRARGFDFGGSRLPFTDVDVETGRALDQVMAECADLD